MLTRFHHQFKLAAPLLGMLAVVVLVLSWAIMLTTPRVGDGIDELTATLAAPQHTIDVWVANNWIVIVGIALIATTITAAGALRHIHTHKKKPTHLEWIALWSGVISVPVAHLMAPGHFGLPLVIIFGFAAAVCII